MRDQNQTGASKPVKSVDLLCAYIIARQEPRHLIKLFNQNGHLPFAAQKETLPQYLKRNCLELIRQQGEEGVRQLLSIHPDKDLLLALFGDKASPLVPESTVRVEDPLHFTGKASPRGESDLVPAAQAALPASRSADQEKWDDPLAVLLLCALCLLIIIALR